MYYVDGNIGILITVINKDIETLNIPQSIIYNNETAVIGDWLENCFSGLTSLRNLTLPSTFQDLPAINNLKSLQTVSVSCKHIPDGYFRRMNLTEINLGKNITTIGKYAFEYCIHLESIQIPGSCLKIGDRAFNGCSNLSNVVFEVSSQAIALGQGDDWSFSSITTFPNPSNVDEERTGYQTGLYYGLFHKLPIERLIINRDIELPLYYYRETRADHDGHYETIIRDIINYPPFYKLEKLKYLEIGENVSAICKNQIEAVVDAKPTTIEYTNFGSCNNIKVVVSNNPNAPIGGGFSQPVYENAYLFIPNGSDESYKNDEYWKRFSQITVSPFIETESIAFDPNEVVIDINESRTLSPIITPNDASIKKLIWSSSHSSIVSVTEDGTITSSSREGEAIINVAACDGSGASSSIRVVVKKGAGISDVMTDEAFNVSAKNGNIFISGKVKSAIVEIFNIQGQLITSSTSNLISLNARGIYFVKIGSLVKKVII